MTDVGWRLMSDNGCHSMDAIRNFAIFCSTEIFVQFNVVENVKTITIFIIRIDEKFMCHLNV